MNFQISSLSWKIRRAGTTCQGTEAQHRSSGRDSPLSPELRAWVSRPQPQETSDDLAQGGNRPAPRLITPQHWDKDPKSLRRQRERKEKTERERGKKSENMEWSQSPVKDLGLEQHQPLPIATLEPKRQKSCTFQILRAIFYCQHRTLYSNS